MGFNGDDIILEEGQTCSWESFNASSEDSALEKDSGYATPATIPCLIDEPGYRWLTKWPSAKLAGSIVLWLLSTQTTVKPMDRFTVGGLIYKCIDVAKWPDTAIQAMLERIDGVD